MTATVQPITPRAFDTVGGFLGQRFHANREKRLKDPLLSEEFMRLHERKAHTIFHWTKTTMTGSGWASRSASGWMPRLTLR